MFMPRQGFLICSSVESACLQHLDQLSADMCPHEQLVRLMQRDSASYGSSVQQVLPYVQKRKKNPSWQKSWFIVCLSYITDNPCTAMHLCGENLSLFYSRPPDALLLMLKTQPSLLRCSSWMKSCILSRCTSQAHTCSTATLTWLGGKGVVCLVWILKLCD